MSIDGKNRSEANGGELQDTAAATVIARPRSAKPQDATVIWAAREVHAPPPEFRSGANGGELTDTAATTVMARPRSAKSRDAPLIWAARGLHAPSQCRRVRVTRRRPPVPEKSSRSRFFFTHRIQPLFTSYATSQVGKSNFNLEALIGSSSKGSLKPEEAPELMPEPQVMIIDYKSNVNLVQSGNSIIALNTTMTADDTWIVDSGATDHMSGNRGLFKTLRLCPENLRVKVANGVVTKVAGIGSVLLTEHLEVHNVLFVPALTCNLISVSKLIKGKRCRVIFDESGCTFQDLNSRRTIGNSKEWDGLYYLEGSNRRKREANKALVSSHSNNEDVLLWHQRLGHPSFDYMKHLFPSLFNKNSVPFSCETCQLAKQKRSTYPQLSYKPTTPFTIIHSDIWGPAKTKTQANARWFVTFIDDHTRTTWVYLMKEKSEVNQIFQSFYSYVKNQFHTSIQILRSDNAKEYLSSSMKEFLTKQGIHHQTSCVYTPQQNGVAERKNRHLLEVTRAIMIERNVPKIFWGDAILTAAYLINRMPSKVLNFSTPIQKLLETYPNSPLIHTLPPKTFGCVVFVHKQAESELDPRADKCIFVGYSPSQKGYKCYSSTTRKTIVSKDVVFYENET